MTNDKSAKENKRKQGVTQAQRNQKVHFQRGETAGRKAEMALDGRAWICANAGAVASVCMHV